MADNICNVTNKGIISKIYKHLIELKKKTNKQPNQKMGRRSKQTIVQQTIVQRRHTDGQEIHEKMLNITNYWRKANQNNKQVAPRTSRMAIIKKTTTHKYWRWFGERGTLLYCWWECKFVQLLWKIVWRCL